MNADTAMFSVQIIVELMADNNFLPNPDIETILPLVLFLTGRVDKQAARASRFFLDGQFPQLRDIVDELRVLEPCGGMFKIENKMKAPLLEKCIGQFGKELEVRRMSGWARKAIEH